MRVGTLSVRWPLAIRFMSREHKFKNTTLGNHKLLHFPGLPCGGGGIFSSFHHFGEKKVGKIREPLHTDRWPPREWTIEACWWRGYRLGSPIPWNWQNWTTHKSLSFKRTGWLALPIKTLRFRGGYFSNCAYLLLKIRPFSNEFGIFRLWNDGTTLAN